MVSDEEIIKACSEEPSMAAACSVVGLHFNTFKRRAVKLGVYDPNQSGKGVTKARRDGIGKIPLEEILDGKHPSYQTFKLKLRLFECGMKRNACELCGVDSWMGKPIQCELDHIDGNSNNHVYSNLRILCPNCHSQTDTFRAKNI